MSTLVNHITDAYGLSMGKLVGGWKPYTTDIDEESMSIFHQVTSDLIGVDYELVAVAKQLVSGMNYSFFCNARVVGSEYNEAVTIRVYVNIHGIISQPEITPVQR